MEEDESYKRYNKRKNLESIKKSFDNIEWIPFDNNNKQKNPTNEKDKEEDGYNYELGVNINSMDKSSTNSIEEETGNELLSANLIEEQFFIPFDGDINNLNSSTKVTECDEQTLSKLISEIATKKDFPNIKLEDLKNYYSDVEEHFFLKEINNNKRFPYKPSFDKEKYIFPTNDEDIFKLLKQLLFLSDDNMTKQTADKHSSLEKDISGSKPQYSNIPTSFIPSSTKIYYCCSEKHEKEDKRFTKSQHFVFSSTGYCDKCDKAIESSNYIVVFDLREQIHLKLLSFNEETIQLMINNNKLEDSKKGKVEFNMQTEIHDINSGLLNHILINNGWYSNCDISFTLLFNTDGVSLKRKSNNYKNVYGFWLAINQLPIEIRFKKENMILLGLFSGKENCKSSASLFSPFLEQFNKAFYPWKLNLREKTLTVRALVLGTTLDSVEIPHIFNINAHNSYFQCCLCDFCGKNAGKTRYFHRNSTGIDYNSSRITRKYRNLLLQRIGTKKDTMIFQGNSKYVDELLSFFPLSVCFSDSLHVIYEGIFDYMLKLMKKTYPNEFELLEEITSNLKCPRQQTHLNYFISGNMSANDLKYFLLSYGSKCLILAGFPNELVQLIQQLAEIVCKIEEKQNKNLTVAQLFEIYFDTLKWIDNYAKYFGNVYVTSKIHKFEHMIIEIILIGKLWTHSCFPFETINLIITRGVKGTSQPIPSIIRSWRKFQYGWIWNLLLQENKETITKLCPDYSKHLFPSNKIPKDRNFEQLAKVTNEDRTSFINWIEIYNNNNNKLCNYIIKYKHNNLFYVGTISRIKKEGNNFLIDVEIYDLYPLIICNEIFLVERSGKIQKDVNPNNILFFYCCVEIQNKLIIFSFN